MQIVPFLNKVKNKRLNKKRKKSAILLFSQRILMTFIRLQINNSLIIQNHS